MKPARPKQAQAIDQAEPYLLRLYVAGSSRQSVRAVAHIKAICEQYLKGRYQLEVIDLYQQPQRAKTDQIIALPTLIKELPLPRCRIIGDLAEADQVCACLGIAVKRDAANGPQPSAKNDKTT